MIMMMIIDDYIDYIDDEYESADRSLVAHCPELFRWRRPSLIVIIIVIMMMIIADDIDDTDDEYESSERSLAVHCIELFRWRCPGLIIMMLIIMVMRLMMMMLKMYLDVCTHRL